MKRMFLILLVFILLVSVVYGKLVSVCDICGRDTEEQIVYDISVGLGWYKEGYSGIYGRHSLQVCSPECLKEAFMKVCGEAEKEYTRQVEEFNKNPEVYRRR